MTSTDRTIGVLNRNRTVEDRLESLPHIQPLRLAADQHRYRFELARGLARRLCGGGSRVLRRDGTFACSRERIEFRLKLGVRRGPLHLYLGDPGHRLRFRVLGLLLCLRRGCGAECSFGSRQLRFGPELEVFRRAYRYHCLRHFPKRRSGG